MLALTILLALVIAAPNPQPSSNPYPIPGGLYTIIKYRLDDDCTSEILYSELLFAKSQEECPTAECIPHKQGDLSADLDGTCVTDKEVNSIFASNFQGRVHAVIQSFQDDKCEVLDSIYSVPIDGTCIPTDSKLNVRNIAKLVYS
jgi:hypothetical protein